mgnify:CR=1 FL=1|tara:strand:+ start:330 stop:1118 length:789 start_codon:yes stop_codon:yes gene_type:complete
MKTPIAIIVLILLGGCSSPGPGEQVWVDDGLANELDGYWLYLPRTYQDDKEWPVLVYLVGGDMAAGPNPRTAKDEGPIRYALSSSDEQLKHYVLDSFIIIHPHMTTGPREQRQWGQHADAIIHIMDQVAEKYHGNKSKVTITGASKGGHGSWDVAKKHPSRFNKIIPISGRINCNEDCKALLNKPIWIIHNDGDQQVESVYSKSAVQWFEDQSVLFNSVNNMNLPSSELTNQQLFTLFPKDGHDAWGEAYSSPQLYQWILRD